MVETQEGTATEGTGSAGFAAAVAAVPEFADIFTLTSPGAPTFLANGNKAKFSDIDGNHFTCGARRGQWKWAFMTGTCYVKVWWNEVKRDTTSGGFGDIVASTPRELTWSPVGDDGLCLPSGFNSGDETTWPASEAAVIEPPEPDDPEADGENNGLGVFIEDVRWSFLDGYMPPGDGSANGWPA